MAPAESVDLSGYKPIMVSCEQDFQASRGPEHQVVVQKIIKEIGAQSEGALSKPTQKGLVKVS